MEMIPELSQAEGYGEAVAAGATFPLAVECILRAKTADGVLVVDPDLRIVHWDGRAEGLTGMLAEEMVGRRCGEALRGECEGGGRLCLAGCAVMKLARAGQPIPSYDMRVMTRMGGRRWLNVSTLSVEAEEGVYLVHLLRDVQKDHDALEMARDLIRLHAREGGILRPQHPDAPDLTPRQREVLSLLAEGRSVKEICRELFLSQATVRNHVRSLLQALGAHSQLEAVASARKMGLLPG